VLKRLFGVTLWCKTLVLRKDKVTQCLQKILPNSAGQLTKFRSSPRQNRPNSAARQSLPFMTENWKSCSKTSVIEGWRCTKGRYVLVVSTAVRIGLKVC